MQIADSFIQDVLGSLTDSMQIIRISILGNNQTTDDEK